MADEVKADKKTLQKYIGKKLAARVLRTWVEDFVDEDTGEVVSIERNEIVLERDTVLDEEAIEMVDRNGCKERIHSERKTWAATTPLSTIR